MVATIIIKKEMRRKMNKKLNEFIEYIKTEKLSVEVAEKKT